MYHVFVYKVVNYCAKIYLLTLFKKMCKFFLVIDFFWYNINNPIFLKLVMVTLSQCVSQPQGAFLAVQ